MLTLGYVSTDPQAGPVRAAQLGVPGWGSALSTNTPTAVMPCVVIDFPGNPTAPVVLEEPTTADAVASAAALLQPVASAAAASAAAQVQAVASNRLSLVQRAQTALGNNASFLANPSLTQAQVVQQVTALTRQTNALIRIVLGSLDNIQGT